jgi:hypothetical protein
VIGSGGALRPKVLFTVCRSEQCRFRFHVFDRGASVDAGHQTGPQALQRPQQSRKGKWVAHREPPRLHFARRGFAVAHLERPSGGVLRDDAQVGIDIQDPRTHAGRRREPAQRAVSHRERAALAVVARHAVACEGDARLLLSRHAR